jgi:hypothetical protein
VALLDKILILEDRKYQAYKALKLDNDHVIYFVGDEIRCSKIFSTSESDWLHIEDLESRKILADKVRVIDEEEQLKDIRDVILNTDITLHTYITKMHKYGEEGSLRLIEPGGYKPKRI